jgi:hypothetical protein
MECWSWCWEKKISRGEPKPGQKCNGRARLRGSCVVQHLHGAAPATVNLTSGGQVPIVCNLVTATKGETPFGRAPEHRRLEPTFPPRAEWRWRGVALWLLVRFAPVAAWASAAKCPLARGVRFAQTGAMAVLLSIGLAACLGSSAGTVAPVRTPTGTYTMTVTAAFTGTGGSTTRSVQVTVLVQ